jgi:ribosome modulation factor
MSKQQAISLVELKAEMSADQAKRDALVAQGRRAYRFGIEFRNNPLRDPSQRTLWENGWELARRDFTMMLQRWGRL